MLVNSRHKHGFISSWFVGRPGKRVLVHDAAVGAELDERTTLFVKRFQRGLTGCHLHRQFAERRLFLHKRVVDTKPLLDGILFFTHVRPSLPLSGTPPGLLSAACRRSASALPVATFNFAVV